MGNTSEAGKLANLRAKRNRELFEMIGGILERGLDVLRRGANGGDEQHGAEVERAHAEAAKLLPLVYGLSDSERLHLERKLDELRAALDGRNYGRGIAARRNW